MAATHLYQIFYSEQTRQELDLGFIPLDNSANARPDWREYWPIRNFLLNHELVEQDYYGFFSPKFQQKTRMTAEQVKAFIFEPPADADIVIFSPMWDMAAFFLNPFEQGETFHPGILKTADVFFHRIRPDVRVGQIITDSRNTVFCNSFAAKPAFWRRWLQIGEDLFSIAESGKGDVAKRLNSSVPEYGAGVQRKVLIMERIATFQMATEERWQIKTFNPFRLPSSDKVLGKFYFEGVAADALKITYSIQPFPEYRDAFLAVRKRVVSQLQAKVY